MIITENISDIITRDDSTLFEVDSNFTSLRNEGKISRVVKFWHEIDGEVKAKEERVIFIITGQIDPSTPMSIEQIDHLTYSQFPMLAP